jgi:hypothetical protein
MKALNMNSINSSVVDVASGLLNLWITGAIPTSQVDNMMSMLGVQTDWVYIGDKFHQLFLVDPSTEDRLPVRL